MSPSDGGRVGRLGRLLLLCAIAVATACSSGSPPVTTSASTPTTSPGQVWLAVIFSAEDPNDLDAPYAQLVGSLAEGSVTHVVVSPSACYSGLPSRYDGRYVLGVWHDSRDAVRAMLDPVGAHPGWIGTVASTCVD